MTLWRIVIDFVGYGKKISDLITIRVGKTRKNTVLLKIPFCQKLVIELAQKKSYKRINHFC